MLQKKVFWVGYTFLQKSSSFKFLNILEENCSADIINVAFKYETFVVKWCSKKGWTDKISKSSAKKNHWSGRVVECLFLSQAGPKRGCLSYLIEIRAIFHTSDVYFLIISIRYDKHPLFGPAFIKMKHSTTRPKQGFFGTKISWPIF